MAKSKSHKVDAGVLSQHLKTLSMKGRIEEATFGKDFCIIVSDVDDEVAVKAASTMTFPEEFAVGDLKQFAKIVGFFKGEIEISLESGQLILNQDGALFFFQCADKDTIPEAPDFDTVEAQMLGDKPLSVRVSGAAIAKLDGFRKLLDSDIVQFTLVEGTVRARQISNATMHEAETELGEVENERVLKSHEKAMVDFKVSGAALRDLMDGIVMDPDDSDDVIMFDFGESLRIRYEGGNYTFLVSPQVPVDGVGESEGEAEE